MRRAIESKRDGKALQARLWREIVEAYLGNSIDDAQMSALLMACVLRGMEREETLALTQAFVESGESLDMRSVPGVVVDKHSSGGVADTASLIVVPMLAACGVPVAKLAGRALGHTGGTIDKLEALAGVRTDLSPERFVAQVREIGCAIAAQSARIVPADKKIYALRDRTGTVPSLGLIAVSIVSKKIAGGAGAIVYDVKAGAGAFMRTPQEARALAELLVDLTRAFGRSSTALVTDMEEPLGCAIGTGLELIEARDVLRGVKADARLESMCRALALEALRLAGRGDGAEDALARVLASGAAAERFERMLAAQGAQAGALDALRPHAEQTRVSAPEDGFVTGIDVVALGERARGLVERDGPTAGIVVAARIGDRVERGAILATVYGRAEAAALAARAFELSAEKPAPRPLLYRW